MTISISNWLQWTLVFIIIIHIYIGQSAEDGQDCRSSTEIYNFTGPVDLVVIFDISQSIAAEDITQNKEMVKQMIIPMGFNIHPDHTRLALMTFAGSHTVLIDDISNIVNLPLQHECILFRKGGNTKWDSVEYVNSLDSTGYVLSYCLKDALSIFRTGMTLRTARKIIITVTDAEWFQSEEISILSYTVQLRQLNVEVFGVGVGKYLAPNKFRKMLSNQGHYCTLADWINLPRTRFVLSDSRPRADLYIEVPTEYCTDVCEEGRKCYCHSLFYNTSREQCLEPTTAVSYCNGTPLHCSTMSTTSTPTTPTKDTTDKSTASVQLPAGFRIMSFTAGFCIYYLTF